MRVVVLMLLAAVLAVPVQAQEEASLTIWSHGEVRDGEEVIWINDDSDDSRATDTANGPGYCPYGSAGPAIGELGTDAGCFAQGEARVEGDFEHTFTMALDPALGDALELDTDGKVVFNVYLGASSGSCEGSFDATLESGGETIAVASDVPVSYDSAYVAFTAEAGVEAATIAADDLTWTIDVACTGDGMFLGVHSDTGKSHFVLPLATASGGPAQPEILEGGVVRADLAAAEATSGQHTFIWLNGTQNATGQYWINVTQGTVAFELMDAADVLQWDLMLDASGNASIEFADAAAGNWTLRIDLVDFAGDVAIALAQEGRETDEPPENQNEGTSTSPPTSGTTSTTSTSDSSTSEAPEEDSPAPGLMLLLIGLALLTWRRR